MAFVRVVMLPECSIIYRVVVSVPREGLEKERTVIMRMPEGVQLTLVKLLF